MMRNSNLSVQSLDSNPFRTLNLNIVVVVERWSEPLRRVSVTHSIVHVTT